MTLRPSPSEWVQCSDWTHHVIPTDFFCSFHALPTPDYHLPSNTDPDFFLLISHLVLTFIQYLSLCLQATLLSHDCRAGVLNLGTTDILDQITSCMWGHPACCRWPAMPLALIYHREPITSLQVATTKMSQPLPNASRRANASSWKLGCFRSLHVGLLVSQLKGLSPWILLA